MLQSTVASRSNTAGMPIRSTFRERDTSSACLKLPPLAGIKGTAAGADTFRFQRLESHGSASVIAANIMKAANHGLASAAPPSSEAPNKVRVIFKVIVFREPVTSNAMTRTATSILDPMATEPYYLHMS